MTDRTPTGDPRATRTVVYESDACQGNITGWDCDDCEDDACECECHDTEPTGGLRERLAHALYRRLREQVGSDAGAQIRAEAKADDLVDAVMPAVEAETAALRQRIEKVEDQRDQALAWQDTAERELRNAERRLDAAERIAAALEAERDKARAAVADEQRRADERRTELLEERDEALNALADAERQARESAADELFQRFQRMREEGEHDMRTALHHVRDVLRSEP